MAKKGDHFMSWAPQDYRSSKVRMRSIMTGDLELRTTYLEILFALYEAGGSLPVDTDLLVDELGIPGATIERCLPILEDFGRRGRGGVRITEGRISNARINEDRQEKTAYRAMKASAGSIGGKKGSAKRWKKPGEKAGDEQTVSSAPAPDNPPTPSPTPTPSGKETNSSSSPAAELGEAKPKTPQQIFVDDCWAIYDRFDAKRPAPGLLNSWAKEIFRGSREWMLSALEDLARSGYLAKGDGYMRVALQGVAQRSQPKAAKPVAVVRDGQLSENGKLRFNGGTQEWEPVEPAA